MKYDKSNILHIVKKLYLIKLLDKLKVVNTIVVWDPYYNNGIGMEVLEVVSKTRSI